MPLPSGEAPQSGRSGYLTRLERSSRVELTRRGAGGPVSTPQYPSNLQPMMRGSLILPESKGLRLLIYCFFYERRLSRGGRALAAGPVYLNLDPPRERKSAMTTTPSAIPYPHIAPVLMPPAAI